MGNRKVGGELFALDVRAEVVKGVPQRLAVQLVDKSLPCAVVPAVVNDDAQGFELLEVAENGVVSEAKVSRNGPGSVTGGIFGKVANDRPANLVHAESLHGSISRLGSVIGWFGISGHPAILPQLFTSAYYTSIKCKGELGYSTIQQAHREADAVSAQRGFIGPLIGGTCEKG